MPWTAGEQTQRLESLRDVLAADRMISMSDNNDWCVPRESNLDLVAMGFALGLDGQMCWEETLDYDPTSEWSKSVDARLAAADKAFLANCGIAEWTNDADVC
jgi:hypothetical protein